MFYATLVAIGGSHLILVTTSMAIDCHLATGHRDKQAIDAFYDFQVAYNKGIINGDGAESFQPVFGIFHQFDANLGDVQLQTLPDPL